MTCTRHNADSRVIALKDLLPSAEQLGNLAYSSLSGDPAARRLGGHGRRAISREDTTGLSKSRTYDSALWLTDDYFLQMAADIHEYAETGTWPRSRRTALRKPCGGTRPIDDPAEIKRLVGLYIDQIIGDRIDAALTPRQFGGRRRTSYVHHCRRQHSTVQDHLARGLLDDIHGGYSKILVIDLANAFGLAPRRAILTALTELGLDEEAARFVWNVAKIQAVDTAGAEVQVDPRWGIEQGNCLSASLMNLVLTPLLRQVESEFDAHGWAFVDDIYITMRSHQDAEQVFGFFRSVARAAGFTNVRRLWTEGDGRSSKNSRIVDTTQTPVRVLKTYDIDALGISLAHEKVEELRAIGLQGRTSLNKIRRFSQCQALTRKAMRARTDLIGRSKPTSKPGLTRDEDNPSNQTRTRARKEEPNPLGPTHGPPRGLQHLGVDRMQVGDEAGGRQKTHETPINTSKGSQVNPRGKRWTVGQGTKGEGKDEAEGPKGGGDGGPIRSSTHHPMGTSLDRSHRNQDLDPGAEDGSPLSWKSVDLPAPDGEGELPGGGVPPPAGSLFFRPFLDPSIVKTLQCGGRLRLGQKVKGRRLVLTGLIEAMGPEFDHRGAARIVTTLIRAVRTHRGAVVLVDPRESWAHLRHVLGRDGDTAYRCAQVVEVDGLLEFHLELRPAPRPRPRATFSPADVAVVIHAVRLSSAARREVSVVFEIDGRRSTQSILVDSPVTGIAKVEAVAVLSNRHRSQSLAVPREGPFHVVDPKWDRTPAHVGLARAVVTLRFQRRWRRSGRWLVGHPSSSSRGSNRVQESMDICRPHNELALTGPACDLPEEGRVHE